MIGTQIGVESKISTNQVSAGSQLISLINKFDNDRVRSLIVIACIFPKVRLDIGYQSVPSITDVIALR